MPQVESNQLSRNLRVFETRYCRRCQSEQEFSRRTIAHRWYLGLTILTFGLWAIPWVVSTLIVRRRPWRCTACGSRFSSVVAAPSPTTPELRPLQITPRQSVGKARTAIWN